MYEEFYGLKARCFSKTPDPAFLFHSRVHAEGLARLQYAVEEREFMLLTGDIGSGKTTLSRALIDSLDERFKPVLILNPRLSPYQFLRALAGKFGIDKPARFKNDLIEQINNRLFKYYEDDECPVVIVDEAQLIPGKDTFEEIRLLTNFQLDHTNLLSIILIGQTELKARLKRDAYGALRQRIGIVYHLAPLTVEDVAEYLHHRLNVGGRKEQLFLPEAIVAIHKHSSGVPRLINTIATGAMLSGLGAEAERIDRNIIEDVVKDLDI